MLRRDGVDAMLTGMIFAAIFVILLVSFFREAYVVASSGAAAETPVAALIFSRPRFGGTWIDRALCPPMPRREAEADEDRQPATGRGGLRFVDGALQYCTLK